MEACSLGPVLLRCATLGGSLDKAGISPAHGAESADSVSVDLQARPQSARVPRDFRPVTPSLRLGFPSVHTRPLNQTTSPSASTPGGGGPISVLCFEMP